MSHLAPTHTPRPAGAQLTATLSVALVLLMLGLVTLLGAGAREAAAAMRDRVGFTVLVSDAATPAQLSQLSRHWQSAPYVREAVFSDPDMVMARYAAVTGDTADIAAELGVNPFMAEYEVYVTAPYASADSLEALAAPLRAYPAIADVVVNADMADRLHNAADSLVLIILILAAALMVISAVLINNTVRLDIHSRRLLIHTMRLVGATDAFIRRPYVVSGLVRGLIGAAVAAVLLALLLGYARSADPLVGETLGWADAAGAMAAMFVAGPLLCAAAAALSANRYLRADYDSLFR